MATRVNIYSEKDRRNDQLSCSSSQNIDDEPQELMLCKICHKEEMETSFIPCNHVYACVKCTSDIKEGLIYSKKIFATM